jgi:hypothetical protein
MANIDEQMAKRRADRQRQEEDAKAQRLKNAESRNQTALEVQKKVWRALVA